MRKFETLSAEVLVKDAEGNPVPLLDEAGAPTGEFESRIKTWTVHEANVLMSMRLDKLNKADLSALGSADSENEDERDSAIQLLGLYMLYTPLAACSEGDVPSFEEFVDEMRETESDEWFYAAKRLNPHWFSKYAGLPAEEVNKKK